MPKDNKIFSFPRERVTPELRTELKVIREPFRFAWWIPGYF